MKVGDLLLGLDVDSADFKKKLQTSATEAGDAAGKTLGERIKSKLTAANIGTVIGIGLGVAMIPALKLADEYDDAMDSLRTKTGQTGDALAGLEQSFKNAAGRVKEDIGVTSAVMAELHQRTGLVGQGLEDMTVRVIEFSRVTGTDAAGNVALVTRLFGDWSIATEDQAGLMDQLLRASQATGIEVDALMQTVVQFGAPLRAMGLSIEESIALLGQWEKEGVNIETVLAGMRMAVGKFAAAGIDPKEGLPALIAQVHTLDDAQGLLAVKQVVGQKAANDFFRAIKEGRFDVTDLMDAIENGSETVQGAAQDTRDFADGIAELKNKVKVAIGPLVDDFAGLATEMGNAIFLLPALIGGLGRVAGMMIGTFIPAVVKSTAALLTKVAAMAAASGGYLAMLGPIGLVVAAIAGIAVVVVGLADAFNRGREKGDEWLAKLREINEESIATGDTSALAGEAVGSLGEAFRTKGAVGVAEFIGQLWGAKEALDEEAVALAAADAALGDNERELRANNQTLLNLTGNVGQFAQAIDKSAPAVRTAMANAWGDTLKAKISQYQVDAYTGGGNVAGEFAQGVKDARDVLRQAWQTFLDASSKPISVEEDLAWTRGKLIGAELAAGLKSADPRVRDAALLIQATLRAEWVKLLNEAYKYGSSAAQKFAQGIRENLAAVEAAARKGAGIIGRNWRLESPAKEGAMSKGGGPEGWGERLGDLYKRGIERSGIFDVLGMLLPTVPDFAPALAGGITQTVRHEGTVHVAFDGSNLPAGVDNEGLGRAFYDLIAREGSGAGLRWSPG